MSRKNPLYPVAVEDPAGKLCIDSRCIKDVKWKILTNFYCNDHIVHPTQTKFTGFLEGKNGTERQGKEDAEQVPKERGTDFNQGTGGGVLPVGGRGEQDAGNSWVRNSLRKPVKHKMVKQLARGLYGLTLGGAKTLATLKRPKSSAKKTTPSKVESAPATA